MHGCFLGMKYILLHQRRRLIITSVFFRFRAAGFSSHPTFAQVQPGRFSGCNSHLRPESIVSEAQLDQLELTATEFSFPVGYHRLPAWG